jgi:hypothetical protein
MAADQFVNDPYAEIVRIPLIDPHTPIDPHRPAARSLAGQPEEVDLGVAASRGSSVPAAGAPAPAAGTLPQSLGSESSKLRAMVSMTGLPILPGRW